MGERVHVWTVLHQRQPSHGAMEYAHSWMENLHTPTCMGNLCVRFVEQNPYYNPWVNAIHVPRAPLVLEVPSCECHPSQLLDVAEDGFLSLMDETGTTREDMKVPDGELGEELKTRFGTYVHVSTFSLQL